MEIFKKGQLFMLEEQTADIATHLKLLAISFLFFLSYFQKEIRVVKVVKASIKKHLNTIGLFDRYLNATR